MNFYEVDFLQRMTALLKEAFKFKKYKAMPNVLAVFTGILMLPIVVASFAATAVLATLGFFYTVLAAPVKFLHYLVSEEGKTVKHASQAIIYLLSWTAIFVLYTAIAFLLFLLIPAYALFSFLLYVWSLGGFKFHLFANYTEDISIEVEGRYKVLPLVYAIIGGIVFVIVPSVHGIIHYFDLYKVYLERLFWLSFLTGIFPVYLGIHTAFSTLYSLIGFARYPKAKAVEAVEEKVEE